MNLYNRLVPPFMYVALAVAIPFEAMGDNATKCTVEVIEVKQYQRHFYGSATVRVKRSNPSRAVELRLAGNVTYRHSKGTATATSLSSVHVEPSNKRNVNVTVTIMPDTSDPDAWVNLHCATKDRCKISEISIDQMTCWDYAKKPEGLLEIGKPKVKIRKSR